MQKKTTKKKFKTYVNFLLDESGSMFSCLEQTISGFNEYFQTLKNDKNDYIFNVVTFNSQTGVKPLFQNALAITPTLSKSNYKPSGNTPLLDAIGKSANQADGYVTTRPGDYNVLFVIMTDGQENDSKEFTRSAINNLIKEKEKTGWTFVYLGAHKDAYGEAMGLGIAAGNTVQYSSIDQHVMLNNIARGTALYASSAGGQSATNFMSNVDPVE